jgi:glyoxylase-like metal-dependent hydrolase (beta-lactamase superfamily II)
MWKIVHDIDFHTIRASLDFPTLWEEIQRLIGLLDDDNCFCAHGYIFALDYKRMFRITKQGEIVIEE